MESMGVWLEVCDHLILHVPFEKPFIILYAFMYHRDSSIYLLCK